MLGGDWDPDRYELGHLMGEGADLQVFWSRDSITGDEVVLKRPHPTLVSRDQHGDVEARTRNLAALIRGANGNLPHLACLLVVSDAARHRSLFGDDLGHDYTVTVQSRARGVPLLGSVVDGLKNNPVGLPMNLFCLHPLRTHSTRGDRAIILDILETAETFHRMGYVLMDLRPQNVFYSPGSGGITLIDVGDFREPREATTRHPTFDMHDMFLDLFRWYVPAADPPVQFESWVGVVDHPVTPRFERAVDDTKRLFTAAEPTEDRAMAARMLDRVRARGYPNVSSFSNDVGDLLRTRQKRLASSADLELRRGLWDRAAAAMHDGYWEKFLFDGGTEMSSYLGLG